MKQIKNVSKGPKGLVACLNSIINTINNLEIVHGAGGPYATVTSKGWILTGQPPAKGTTPVEPGSAPAAGSSGGGGGAGDGAWLTIDVMSDACVRSTIQVWSRPVPTDGGGA